MRRRSDLDSTKKIAAAFLGLYGFIIFFENSYFSAPFYGVQTPSWAKWVGVIPLWALDLLDTFALVGIILLVIPKKPKRRGEKKRTS